jgi:hypothetical protein
VDVKEFYERLNYYCCSRMGCSLGCSGCKLDKFCDLLPSDVQDDVLSQVIAELEKMA